MGRHRPARFDNSVGDCKPSTQGQPNHGKVVAAGKQHLLESLRSDGKYATISQGGQYMYGHGIATIVLAELYGQTKSETMRPKLEKKLQILRFWKIL